MFKGAYEQAVYDGYQRNGLSPVHTEISMQKGERIDVGVLGTQNPTVSWENGSKKFDDGDVDALYELKFVKNRKKPPTTSGFKPYKERHGNYAKGTLQDAIDWGTVGVKPDVEALGRTSLKYRAVLVFSNFNYYYHRPTQEEVDHAPLYEDLGNAAWDVLETVGDDMAVNVIYVAPEFPGSGKGGENCGGMTWIHEEIGLP